MGKNVGLGISTVGRPRTSTSEFTPGAEAMSTLTVGNHLNARLFSSSPNRRIMFLWCCENM